MSEEGRASYSVEELIDSLIANWNDWENEEEYYLSILVPKIVEDLEAVGLTDDERAVAEQLQSSLGPDRWGELPALVSSRVKSWRSSHTSDRLRRSLDEWLELERRKRRERELEEKARKAREREEEERRQRQELESLRLAHLERVRAELRRDFLSVRNMDQGADGEPLSVDDYQALRREVAKEWVAGLKPRGDWTLDEEQLAAVTATEGDVRVTARAGSGKTRTLVARALFLQTHCKVDPSEILLLAFNRNAAQEMEDRIRRIAKDRVPHVMTFHALAHALVHPEEDLVSDDESAGSRKLSGEIQEVIDEHIRSTTWGPQVRELMLSHFRDDWERIVEGGHNLTMSEFLEARRAAPRETLQGEYVKSYGEKLIANILFEHSVDYEYEKNFRWNGVNYRPDFTLRNKVKRGDIKIGVVIEYFGLQGSPEYDERSEEKRKFWKGQEGYWKLLEFSPTDVRQGPEEFQKYLLAALHEQGIETRARTEEEVWQLVRSRAIDQFTRAMRVFVGRCRKRNLDDEGLQELLDATPPPISRAERLFGALGKSIYQGYLRRLASEGKEDFDGLMWRAIDEVRGGHTRFRRRGGREQGDLRRIRFVHIDEFQDFSEMFLELIAGVRQWTPEMSFFCVGDDWQAINGFAGSELRYFYDFDALFRQTSSLEISTNYRSGRSVVEVGNTVMQGRGTGAKANRGTTKQGQVLVANLDEFTPTGAEEYRHRGDEITPALLRLLQSLLVESDRVVLLARRRAVVPWYVNFSLDSSGSSDRLDRFLRHLRSFLPELDRKRLIASTVHSFKGGEEDGVVVLDAVQGSFPLIHPNWVFLRAFGDHLDRILEEERRLFYVAVTRARSSLVLLTEDLRRSPFLDGLDQCPHVENLIWDKHPPLAIDAEELLEVRISWPYQIHDQFKDRKIPDQLKNRGFGYKPPPSGGPFWYRTVPKDDFNPEKLLGEPWIQPGLRIVVLSEQQNPIFERTIEARPGNFPGSESEIV